MSVLKTTRQLISGSMLMTVATVFSGLIGYFYQILMANFLEPVEYVTFAAIMATAVVFASPLNAMFMVVSRRVTQFKEIAANDVMVDLYIRVFWRLVFALFVGSLFLFLFHHNILNLLNLSSLKLLPFLLVIPFASALFLLNQAYLQGAARFDLLGSSGILAITIRLLISLILVKLSLGVYGALLGVVSGSIIAWLVYLSPAVLSYRSQEKRRKTLGHDAVMKIDNTIPVLVANVCFALMTQFDLILANKFFISEVAASYTAAAVIGKAVLYLPGGIALALFPLVAGNADKPKSQYLLLYRALMLTAGLCALASLGLLFLSEFIIEILYGQKYVGAEKVLRWYGFAMFPLSLVLIAENFLIARGRVIFAWLFLLIAPLILVAVYLIDAGPSSFIIITGASGSLLFIFGLALVLCDYKKYIRSRA